MALVVRNGEWPSEGLVVMACEAQPSLRILIGTVFQAWKGWAIVGESFRDVCNLNAFSWRGKGWAIVNWSAEQAWEKRESEKGLRLDAGAGVGAVCGDHELENEKKRLALSCHGPAAVGGPKLKSGPNARGGGRVRQPF